jgi:heme exporter protein C
MTSASLRHAVAADTAVTEPPRSVFRWLFPVSVLAVIGIYIRAIYFTPIEALQGAAQKIYYVHVPSAVGAYLAVGITALASIIYLWLRDERADRLAEASAEVGLVFLTMVLITGPLWAHKIWGAWWDLRLTLTLFLWFVVAGYLIMRGGLDEPAVRARYSAVLAVLGALLIPFIHMSVYFALPRMHPMPIVFKPSEPSLPGEMLTTFLLSMGAFALLCIALIQARYRLAVLRELAEHDEEGTR